MCPQVSTTLENCLLPPGSPLYQTNFLEIHIYKIMTLILVREREKRGNMGPFITEAIRTSCLLGSLLNQLRFALRYDFTPCHSWFPPKFPYSSALPVAFLPLHDLSPSFLLLKRQDWGEETQYAFSMATMVGKNRDTCWLGKSSHSMWPLILDVTDPHSLQCHWGYWSFNSEVKMMPLFLNLSMTLNLAEKENNRGRSGDRECKLGKRDWSGPGQKQSSVAEASQRVAWPRSLTSH